MRASERVGILANFKPASKIGYVVAMKKNTNQVSTRKPLQSSICTSSVLPSTCRVHCVVPPSDSTTSRIQTLGQRPLVSPNPYHRVVQTDDTLVERS